MLLSAILAALIITSTSAWAVPAYREHRAQVERQKVARALFGEPLPLNEEPATLPGPGGMEWRNSKARKNWGECGTVTLFTERQEEELAKCSQALL